MKENSFMNCVACNSMYSVCRHSSFIWPSMTITYGLNHVLSWVYFFWPVWNKIWTQLASKATGLFYPDTGW